MGYSTLLVSIRDRIAFVTVNRPDKLNALNAECKEELRDLFTRLRTGSHVDAVILTGKAFSAGVDIADHTPERVGEMIHKFHAIFHTLWALEQPVVAAVQGAALGGGCELALACHIRIAAESAKFGQPEVNLGIIPGYGGTQRLPRLVGFGQAMEMILTGNQINAQEAMRIGLVNKVVPLSELLPAAEAMARTILGKGQLAVRMAIKAINATLELPLSEGLRLEAALFGESCSTDDFKEGTSAFSEKRKPAFKGS